jgi:hypothetical protein
MLKSAAKKFRPFPESICRVITIGLWPVAIRAVWRKINLYNDKDTLLTCVNALHTSYCVSKHLVRALHTLKIAYLKVLWPLRFNVSPNNVTTRSYLTENTACLHYKDRRACAACCDNRTKQDKHSTYKGNIEARSLDLFCRGKVIRITHSEFVCMCLCVCLVLFIQHALRMRHILYCHVWPVWLYHIFPLCFINGTIFGRK